LSRYERITIVAGPTRATVRVMRIPASPDELSADWLTSVLSAQGWGPCRVESFATEMFGGEQGITGELARLRIRYRDERPGPPATVIAKFSAPEPGARAMISELGHYEREVGFYELLASRTPVPVPRCCSAHHDVTSGPIDMGDWVGSRLARAGRTPVR